MALSDMGLLSFDGRAGGAGAKQKAGGINWSCGAMELRTGGGMGVHLCASG